MTGNCKLFCWIAAAIAGLILWLFIGGFWGFVIGAVAAVVLGWLLVTYVCKADDMSASVPEGSSQSPDAVAAPPAAPAPGASPAPVAAPMAGAAATTPATAEADRPANAGAATAAPAPAPAPVTGTAATDAPAAEPEAPAPAPAGTATVTEPAAPIADENATNTANVAAPLAGADAGEGTRPSGLTAPREGGADDLKRIKGVGPKLENMLNEMGYYHFDQIAAWSADEVAWVDQNLEGFKGRVSRDEWVSQAKQLSSGQEREFSKRVDKGGVY